MYWTDAEREVEKKIVHEANRFSGDAMIAMALIKIAEAIDLLADAIKEKE